MHGPSPESEPPAAGATTPAPHAAHPATHAPQVHIADPSRLLPPHALTNLLAEAQAAAAQALIESGYHHAPHGAPPSSPPSSPGEVRIRLVSDAEMSEAHLKYSDIPGTTDVLTFDLAEGASATGAPLDVDILICVDEARRQAALHTHALEREILLYILHGILHCLGYNDHTDDDYQRMHAEEDRILHAIGIGPIFGYPHAPHGAPPEPPPTQSLTTHNPGLRT